MAAPVALALVAVNFRGGPNRLLPTPNYRGGPSRLLATLSHLVAAEPLIPCSRGERMKT